MQKLSVSELIDSFSKWAEDAKKKRLNYQKQIKKFPEDIELRTEESYYQGIEVAYRACVSHIEGVRKMILGEN